MLGRVIMAVKVDSPKSVIERKPRVADLAGDGTVTVQLEELVISEHVPVLEVIEAVLYTVGYGSLFHSCALFKL